jgi:hypothetical protein
MSRNIESGRSNLVGAIKSRYALYRRSIEDYTVLSNRIPPLNRQAIKFCFAAALNIAMSDVD